MRYCLSIGLIGIVCTALSAGEIARQHDQLMMRQGTEGKPRTMEQIESRAHGITEIGLERSVCYGTCQSYTAIIRSDGTLTWDGHAHVKRMGRRTARISQEMFHEIAQFIQDSGFQQLAANYELPITDQQSVYTLVVMNGQRKIVRNYGKAGPIKLWAIEQLIEKLIVQATWSDP